MKKKTVTVKGVDLKSAEVRFFEIDHNSNNGMCEMRLRSSVGKILGRMHIPQNVFRPALGWLLDGNAPNLSSRLGGLNNDESK